MGEEGTGKVLEILRTASTREDVRLLVPFTALAEREVYLLRRLPTQVDQVLTLVETWPVPIPESYPQGRREAARLQATLDLAAPRAWTAALALLHNAQLVHKDPAFEAVPGLQHLRLP